MCSNNYQLELAHLCDFVVRLNGTQKVLLLQLHFVLLGIAYTERR